MRGKARRATDGKVKYCRDVLGRGPHGSQAIVGEAVCLAISSTSRPGHCGMMPGTFGLSVELDDDLNLLRTAVQVGGRSVGNRLAIQPMEGCDADLDGSPGELTFRRYHRFGAGGAKLIWGEACAVVPEGRANPRQLVINPANALRSRGWSAKRGRPTSSQTATTTTCSSAFN